MNLEEMSWKRATLTLMTSTVSGIILFKGAAMGIESEQVQAVTAIAIQGANALGVLFITFYENKINRKVAK